MNPLVSTKPMSTTQTRLRNSCDACNTAKVKCSKERPSCRRCNRKEQFCVYSVSLRCSKRPVDNRVKKNVTSAQPITSVRNDTRLPLNSPLDGPLGAIDAPLTSGSSVPTSLYDFDPLSSLSEVNFDLDNLDDYFSTEYLPPANFNAYATPTTASTPPQQPTLTPTLSRAAQLCGCQQHILSKLSEISLSSGTTTVAFDRALSENRAIVALCTNTLDCTTCARAEDIMLILTLSALLSHVLQVFETLFRNRREALHPRLGDGHSPADSTTDTTSPFNMFTALELLTPPASVHGSRAGTTAPSGVSTPNNGTAGAPSFSSPVDRGPAVRLSLGSYELDERDELILQNSLLKIELGKIGALVEAFEARLGQTKVHRDLVAYLKMGLGANYEALKRLAGACC